MKNRKRYLLKSVKKGNKSKHVWKSIGNAKDGSSGIITNQHEDAKAVAGKIMN